MALPIILDTDVGDDIDDAYALAFICRSPEFDLRAVTTVYGHTQERARLAASIMQRAGHAPVPVACGASGGLTVAHTRGAERRLNFDGFNQRHIGLPADELPPVDQRTAAQLIIDTVRAQPGEVVPVAIGALTNIALALVLDPELAEMIPRIVIMACEFEEGFPEWNIVCDPIAAEIVLNSGVPIAITPWIIGSRGTLSTEQLERVMTSTTPLGQVIASCTQAWIDDHPGERPHLYDPLAVLGIIRPDLFTWKQGSVEIATHAHGEQQVGMSTFIEDEASPHRIMTDLQVQPALDEIIARVTR